MDSIILKQNIPSKDGFYWNGCIVNVVKKEYIGEYFLTIFDIRLSSYASKELDTNSLSSCVKRIGMIIPAADVSDIVQFNNHFTICLTGAFLEVGCTGEELYIQNSSSLIPPMA